MFYALFIFISLLFAFTYAKYVMSIDVLEKNVDIQTF